MTFISNRWGHSAWFMPKIAGADKPAIGRITLLPAPRDATRRNA
jgi:hypothetical protein